MSMSKSFFLLEPFHTIPIKEQHQWFGRIVKNFANPREDFAPDNPTVRSDWIQEDAGFSNVDGVLKTIQHESARLLVDGLFGVSGGKTRVQDPDFKARKVQRVRLEHATDVLKQILSEKSTRTRVLNFLGMRTPAYFIVGFLATDHIHYSDGIKRERTFDLDIRPPIKAAAMAVGIPIPRIELLDVGTSIVHGEETKIGTEVLGSRIFAVEHRILRRRLINSSKPMMIRTHGLTGVRMFVLDASTDPVSRVTSEQKIEFFLDDEDISEVEEAEDFCFSI